MQVCELCYFSLPSLVTFRLNYRHNRQNYLKTKKLRIELIFELNFKGINVNTNYHFLREESFVFIQKLK